MNVTQIPHWHLEQCWETPELNEWWTKVWMKGTVLHGNIHPGDLFSHGEADQISVVASRITIVEKGESHFQYTLGHNLGGHDYSPKHERLADGYFIFIPSAVQLTKMGQLAWAQDLLLWP